MFSRRFLSMVSTTTLVLGALLIGDALHGSVVTGIYGVTSPAFVLRVLPGLVLVWLGYTLRENREMFLSAFLSGRDAARSNGGTGNETEEFDERLSPLSEESLSNLEARERDRDETE